MNTDLGFSFENSPDRNANFLEHFHSRPANSISLFTDRSRKYSNDDVGAAFFSPDLSISALFGLNNQLSTFSAECVAIKNPIELATTYPHKNVFIYLDCMSALQALSKYSLNVKVNPFVLDVRKIIDTNLRSKRNLYLFWIPSHVGISYNKNMDASAKNATVLDISTDILVPSFDFTESFNKQVKV